MENLKISLIQSHLHWESPEENLKSFGEKIKVLKKKTDLIILPEMFTTGFTMNAPALAETKENSPALNFMREKAAETGAVITGSIIFREEEFYFNRLFWVNPNGSFSFYDKRHLFRMAGEHTHYAPGKDKLIVLLKGWKINPLICYDLRFPVWARNRYDNLKGWEYDLQIYVANWPQPRIRAWEILLQARAIENQCYTAGVNRVGTDGQGIEYSGHSRVSDPKGQIISSLLPGEEGIETLELNGNELKRFREQFPVGLDAGPFQI
jgi:omega-amidase